MLTRKYRTPGIVAIVVIVGVATTAGVLVRNTEGSDNSARLAAAARTQQLARGYGARAAELIRRRDALLHGARVQVGPPDGLAIAAMRNVALRMAALSDEAHPVNGLVWSASRKAAAAADSGAKVDTDQPVYIVVIHGNFVGNLASPPPSAALPAGHAMTVTFDATTLDVTDWGIAPAAPRLDALGKGVSLGL